MRGLMLGFSLWLFASSAASAAPPGWDSLDWLVGRWTADGDPSQGTGGFSFSKEAGGQIIVRRNFADYPARPGKPAEHHEDLMVIWQEAAATRATYWDSEGHQIHYAVTAPAAGEVDFVSDDTAGPGYRLRYQRRGADLEGSFEIAPPDKRDAFLPYLAWTAARAR